MRAFLLSLPLLAACSAAGPHERLRELYQESRATVGTDWDPERLARHEEQRRERIAETLRLNEAGSISGEGRLYAAGILLESPLAEELELARDLALDAAEDGDERGLRLAAEAIDRRCMVRGEMQRFGTQYVFSPVTERWDLYPWDPITTDTERVAMGVPTLADALARLDELNPPHAAAP